MYGHAAMRDDRMLRRIVALLVALAVLAEQVAHRSAPVRFIVLWLLRRAEAVAAEFVFEETGLPAPAAECIAAADDGPAEALHLAAQFRALAAALAAMLPDTRWLGRRSARRRPAPGHLERDASRLPGGWRYEPNDTS